jgi:hypothetical protein
VTDSFYATTRIKFGKLHKNEDPTKDDRHETIWFEPDEKVTGVDVDEMQRLWNAGALRKETAEDREREAAKRSRTSEKPDGDDGGKSPETPSAPNKPAAPAGKK